LCGPNHNDGCIIEISPPPDSRSRIVLTVTPGVQQVLTETSSGFTLVKISQLCPCIKADDVVKCI
jgi:hypothetical protein